MNLCQCVHSHHISCLMQRYNASEHFAVCMGGCSCPCHFLKNGAFVPREEWLEHRYAVARAKQMEERHTDPRIEALMPQEVKER